jgi:hypothetical protein
MSYFFPSDEGKTWSGITAKLICLLGYKFKTTHLIFFFFCNLPELIQSPEIYFLPLGYKI